jgi:putative membrane protein
MTQAERFFSDEEKTRISNAVRQAESKTTGEIVVRVADCSDHYHEAEIAGALFFTALLSFVSYLLLHAAPLWAFIAFFAVTFFPCKMLLKLLFTSYPQLKLHVIPTRRKEEAVYERAREVFIEQGLENTTRETGVLFYFSLFERTAWVLADKGIYEKISQETLEKFAAIIVQGVKENRACDALCLAVRDTGELLAQYFPVKADDPNELPDDVRAVPDHCNGDE